MVMNPIRLLLAPLERAENSIVLADGLSCRTQPRDREEAIEQLAGLPSRTLAQLLADHHGPPAVVGPR